MNALHDAIFGPATMTSLVRGCLAELNKPAVAPPAQPVGSLKDQAAARLRGLKSAIQHAQFARDGKSPHADQLRQRAFAELTATEAWVTTTLAAEPEEDLATILAIGKVETYSRGRLSAGDFLK